MIDTGLAFDVCWEVRSGPQGASYVRSLLERWPVMRPLVLVLKVFLTQRELNEVYSGGIGSYTLIVMTAAMLQLHGSRRGLGGRSGSSSSHAGAKRSRPGGCGAAVAAALDGNVGLLLVDFFRCVEQQL
jgi:non-canonical poly(A) RNA polymerase PAPD5/7